MSNTEIKMPKINYNPDVLTCLANLSNDEVFTPPNLVNDILNLLPESIWKDKNIKFLDPVSKSGVFLREITKRLNKGLEDIIIDQQERLDHIFKNQLYGIAITELTSLLSRRSLYCSKNANSEYSVCQKFENSDGNIRFKEFKHIWESDRCSYCGVNKDEFDRDELSETHAYEFIHNDDPNLIFGKNMKFDVIIGNPPYQINDGGNGVSAKPIFNLFVEQAKKLNPRYLSMIIPARWYAGGKGLDDFRNEMLNDSRMKVLVDFESSKDCFKGVNIAGGICYFLWQNDYDGPCEVINVNKNNNVNSTRNLNEYSIFIRANKAIPIIKKVLSLASDTLDNHNYPRNPFGFSTKDRGKNIPTKSTVALHSSQGIGFVERAAVIRNPELIDQYKIVIGRLVPSNGELDVNPEDGYRVITSTKILKPGEICTETYLVIGAFYDEKEAQNFDKFIKLKFPRFLLRQSISSVNVTRDCFRMVPFENFNEIWTDDKLYKKYNLNKDEIDYVESMIRHID